MKPELCVRAGLVIAMLAAGSAVIAEDFAPGVQHICIPNAARDGWDCGTIDNPPKPAVVEEKFAEEPAPQPPPFLMNPEGPAAASETIAEEPAAPEPEPLPEAELETPVVASEPAESAAPVTEESTGEATPLVESEVAPPEATVSAPAPIETPTAESAAPVAVEPMESEPLPEPVAAETENLPEPEAPAVVAPEPETAVAAETVSAPATESAAEPVVAESAQPSAVDVADAPVSVESMPESEPVPVAEPEPVAVPVAETPAAPSPARSTPAPAPVASSGRLYLSSLHGARDFAKLPPAYFTLQLAHAPSAEPFPALIQQLGIDHRQCYVLRVRRDDGDWFVLAYGSFADASIAKAALMRIRPAPGMTAVWPRRVGYLQGEYRP